MPSPFPGMHPYREHADVWQDFHPSFIPLFRRLMRITSTQMSPIHRCKAQMRSGHSSGLSYNEHKKLLRKKFFRL